jgi:hypothetical protein
MAKSREQKAPGWLWLSGEMEFLGPNEGRTLFEKFQFFPDTINPK